MMATRVGRIFIVVAVSLSMASLAEAGRTSDRKALRSFKGWTTGSWKLADSTPLRLSLPAGKGRGRGFFEATPCHSSDRLSPLEIKSKRYRLRRGGKLLKLSGKAIWKRSAVRQIGGPNWVGTFRITARRRGRSRLVVSGNLRTASGSQSLSGQIATKTGGRTPIVPVPWMEMVMVGNTGNSPEPWSPVFPAESAQLGAVGYVFKIGRYEVTNSQYAEFLNAVAASDPHGLYNPLMGSNARGGITRSNSSPNFTYATRTDMADKPVTFVSFWDACRFCNWLHNDRPTGSQSDSTTEDGAYTLTAGTISANTVFRNPGAKYFLPSENEWHKAAYHEPGGGYPWWPGPGYGTPSGFWRFGTRSNDTPAMATADLQGNILTSPPVDATNIANYGKGADWNGQDGNLTTVGSGGTGNACFYGAFDFCGNCVEWTEARHESGPNQFRVVRGGAWTGTHPPGIGSLNGREYDPAWEDAGDGEAFFGFRVGMYETR